MLQAIQNINDIIKELAVIRLKTEGGIDGRVSKGIAEKIIKVVTIQAIPSCHVTSP